MKEGFWGSHRRWGGGSNPIPLSLLPSSQTPLVEGTNTHMCYHDDVNCVSVAQNSFIMYDIYCRKKGLQAQLARALLRGFERSSKH